MPRRSCKRSMDDTQQTYPLHSIYFYLTEGCNLRCRHCWIAPKFQAKGDSGTVLPMDIFRSVVAQGKKLGLSSVKLTGGEPLLHPRISEILAHIKNEDLNLVMESNGVLCTPEIAEQIAACNNPYVSVSLDGADAQTHEWVRGVPGCFQSALEGIDHLVQAGIPFQIIMSIMRANRDQMEPVVRLAEELGAVSVKFNLVMPIARGAKMQAGGETLSIEELVELGAWVENSLAASTDVRVHYDHPPAFRPLSKLFGEQGDGCTRCGILGIIGVLASGVYSMCGIGENVAELRFGNAATDQLEAVWRDTPVFKELRDGLPGRLEGVCQNCLMKSLCKASCIALNYYQTRRLWAPFWFCDQANGKKLFPKTRMREGVL